MRDQGSGILSPDYHSNGPQPTRRTSCLCILTTHSFQTMFHRTEHLELFDEGFATFDPSGITHTHALKPPIPKDAAASTYELAMLLHALGRHPEGDSAAKSLGFKHRLNDAIFQGGKGVKAREDGGDYALVHDGLLEDDGLLEGLEEVFGPDSSFWSSHDYPTDCEGVAHCCAASFADSSLACVSLSPSITSSAR